MSADIPAIRGCFRWLPGCLAAPARRQACDGWPRHLLFCVADHFEPFGAGQGREATLERVSAWLDRYRASAGEFRDADGRPPRHTFFTPQDEYDAAAVERLCAAVAEGWGEVEVHLHHRGDTAEGLRATLSGFRDRLHEGHGLLGTDAAGRARYGFVHGNWALCNSRPDGDWCGVNEELGVLAATGCYADFTFPSAPSPTQPRMVNTIYRATDRSDGRGHDRGIPCATPAARSLAVRPSAPPSLPLMLIQGPLALDWGRRKWGLLPRLENADLSRSRPPSPERVGLWVRQNIHVAGRPEWVFVKVHTHGAVPSNADILFGDAMRRTREHLQTCCNDGMNWRLHYVTAREMYNLVRAAEDGHGGDPAAWRDYELAPPQRSGGRVTTP